MAGVRLAVAADVDAVADVLACAYVGDPWIAWIVPADGRNGRVRALQASLLADVLIPHGEVWVADDEDGRVVGAASWILADHPVPAEAWSPVAAREVEFFADHHPRAVAAATHTRGLRPDVPHDVLASLGVLASDRGRGLGSALLMPVLERTSADVYLETSAEQNLNFYRRLGFAVTGHVQLPDGGPDVWAMRRWSVGEADPGGVEGAEGGHGQVTDP